MKYKRLLFICMLATCIGFPTWAFATVSPPTDVEAAPGDGSAAVSFEAPIAGQNATITGYTVTAYTGGTVDTNAVDSTAQHSGGSTALIHIITGLTNGQAYTFTVTATVSGAGSSTPSSVSNSVTPSSAPCPQLVGQWNIGAIMSGQDAPFSQVCTLTVNQDGTTSGDCSDNGASEQSFTGNLWVFPDGVRPTLNGSDSLENWLCQANTLGTVMACTANPTDGSDSSYMSVGTKMGGPYSAALDLPGQWLFDAFDIISDNDASWTQGNVTVSSNASFTGTSMGSNGKQQEISGVLSLSNTGELSCISGSCKGSSFGYMDAGMTVVAGVSPYSSSSNTLQVVVKNAGPYNLPDISGEWASNELRSDGTWKRMTIQVYRDGDYIDSVVESNGSGSTGMGRLAIDNSGVVTCAKSQPSGSTCSDVNLVMDAGKTVLTDVGTNTNAVSSLQVFTLVASLFQNATHLGGGWEHSKWFGLFYPEDSSPWIYNQNLGWLFPYGTSDASIWFYDPQMGAFWWTSQTVFPYVYRSSDQTWLYNEQGTSWFYNFKTKKWEYN